MVKHGIKDGRVILVSSTVGLMGMVGYSQYSPTKWAIRGLAECLRQEFILYSIKVHVYFVATIESPGFAAETKTKPSITKAIEGSENTDKSPKARALALIEGIRKEQFMIASDWMTDIFRVAAIGITPRNFLIKDFILLLLSWILLPIWRMYADYLVRKERKVKSQ